MADDSLFDLDRGDVLSAGDDDVLAAVPQLDVAVGMGDPEISGVEPASPERVLGRLGVGVIALHDVVSPHDDLAHRLAVTRHVVHLIVHHPDGVGADECNPLTSHQPHPFLRGGIGPLGLGLTNRIRPIGLGESVDMNDLGAQLGHLGDDRRAGRGAGGRDHERISAPLGQRPGIRVVGHRHQDGGGGIEMRDAVLSDRLPDRPWLGSPQTDVGAADRRHTPGGAPAVAVKHRKRPQIDGFGHVIRVDHLREGVEVSAPMAVHHTLRSPCCARRVVDRDRPFFVIDPERQRVERSARDEVLEGSVAAHHVGARCGVVKNDHLPECRATLEMVRHDRVERRVDHQDRGTGMIEDVSDFSSGQPGVDGDEHCRDQRNREMGDQHLGEIRHQIRHPISLAHAGSHERTRGPDRLVTEVGVAEPAVLVDDRRLGVEDVG